MEWKPRITSSSGSVMGAVRPADWDTKDGGAGINEVRICGESGGGSGGEMRSRVTRTRVARVLISREGGAMLGL